MRKVIALLCVIGCVTACSDEQPSPAVAPAAAAVIDEVADGYLRLVLMLGEHDSGYVDAYYGPPEIAAAIAGQAPGLVEIAARAEAYRRRLPGLEVPAEQRLRVAYLDKQLIAIAAHAQRLSGQRFSFDEETQLLYDAVSPPLDDAYFSDIIAQLYDIFGDEIDTSVSFSEWYAAWRSRFIIPDERLDAVFQAAINECRDRTRAWLTLPDDEQFVLEYVTDKPWTGYNWYQGGHRSLIQLNRGLPLYIDRAVDLGCHEGYPGHHVYNALLETELVEKRGWTEFSVYPLFSPQSLIAEGSANYGIEMAFPGDQRMAFERDVLFPLAGFEPAEAEKYFHARQLIDGLNYASNVAAQRYLDGEIDREQAVQWLIRHGLYSEERARQRLDFIDTYRGYVINYNLGRDMVRAYIEAAGDEPAARWQRFGELLGSPRLPSDLKVSDTR